jgi:hypothetical protein
MVSPLLITLQISRQELKEALKTRMVDAQFNLAANPRLVN